MQDEKTKTRLLNSLENSLIHQFQELSECDHVDIRFLWEENKISRYRVNGWDTETSKIVFSVFVTAFNDIKGIQFRVIDDKTQNNK